MSQEQFWILLSKKLAGEASVAELKELEQLIVEHPEWQYAIQNLEDLWKHGGQHDLLQSEDAFMLHLNRLSEEGKTPFEHGSAMVLPTLSKKWLSRGIYWAAASLVGIVGVWLWLRNPPTKQEKGLASKEHNEVSTRPGSRSTVKLPDGSVVMLNAGSKLVYKKDYGQGTREVTLTGEGFFDVKEMKNVPFIIHTSSIDIKVLGTLFNVKAYPEDKKTETSLIRGRIEITIKNRPNDKVFLSPSEKLIVDNSDVLEIAKQETSTKDSQEAPPLTTLMSVNKLKYNPEDSSVAETQWVDNKLVFRDEPFEELAVMMERWYNVEIEITDDVIKSKRLTGIFENETIEQALEALKIIVPFQHERQGNKIIIHH